MTKLLIVDTETTSLEQDTQVCEVAATFYNVDSDVRKCGAIASVSFLIPVTENKAESVNGITPELTELNDFGGYGHLFFCDMVHQANYLVGFNSDYDKPLVNNLIFDLIDVDSVKWVCAMSDFDWEYPNKSKYGNYSLINLALHFGIGVSTAHRADLRILTPRVTRSAFRPQTCSGIEDCVSFKDDREFHLVSP